MRPVSMRYGFDGRPHKSRTCCRLILSPGICSCSVAKRGQARDILHTVFVTATIAYRWHPLFGRTLQVSPFRRGKDLTCIYTAERPDLSRELPNWMFDEAYCAGMTLGAPQISIEGLNELAAVLALLGENRSPGTRSQLSKPKEGTRAEKPIPQSGAARSRAGAPMQPLQ